MLDYNPSFCKTDTTGLLYDVFGRTNEKARFFYTHMRHLHRTERGFCNHSVPPPLPSRVQGLTKTGLVLFHVRVLKAASRDRPTCSTDLNQTKSTPAVLLAQATSVSATQGYSLHFMEPNCSLQCSKQPATCNYPQPDQFSARSLNRLDPF